MPATAVRIVFTVLATSPIRVSISRKIIGTNHLSIVLSVLLRIVTNVLHLLNKVLIPSIHKIWRIILWTGVFYIATFILKNCVANLE